MTKKRKPQHSNPATANRKLAPRIGFDPVQVERSFAVMRKHLTDDAWAETQSDEFVSSLMLILAMVDLMSKQMNIYFDTFEKYVESVMRNPTLYFNPEEPTPVPTQEPEEGIEKPATPHE